MTTREFISKNFGVAGREKTCSSVFKDFDGNIYSYGYHYPLLIKVGNKVFRNVSGYSNTTARHIQWSRDIDAINIHFDRDFRLGNDAWNIQSAKSGQLKYIDSLKRQLDAKKRKNTQVYKWLEYHYKQAVKNYESIEG
jgi:hypothetical protein